MSIREFILLGSTNTQKLKVLLFLQLQGIYIVTTAGNILVVALFVGDQNLHTPMYFFLLGDLLHFAHLDQNAGQSPDWGQTHFC